MISFVIFAKKIILQFGCGPGWPLSSASKFTNFFFRTTGLQHKFLILIESPNKFHLNLQNNNNNNKNKNKVGVVLGQITSNVNKKSKKTHIINSLLSYSAYGIHLKNGVEIINTWVEIFDQYSYRYHIWWKLGPNVCSIWVQKWQKKIIFTPVTSLPTQFSLKTKFLTAIVS